MEEIKDTEIRIIGHKKPTRVPFIKKDLVTLRPKYTDSDNNDILADDWEETEFSKSESAEVTLLEKLMKQMATQEQMLLTQNGQIAELSKKHSWTDGGFRISRLDLIMIIITYVVLLLIIFLR